MAKWTAEQLQKVQEMSGQGKSIRQIADVTGISKSSVNLLVKKPVVPQVPNPVGESGEINLTDIIETTMISEADANSFMSQVGPVQIPTGSTVKPILPTKTSGFMNDLLTSKIPEAEHMESPFKARHRPVAVPKTPKPKATKVLDFLDKMESKDDSATRADLIAKITFNVNSFDSLLTEITKGDKTNFLKGLDKLNVSTLQLTLKTIETTRSVKNLTNQFLQFFWVGTTLVEVGTQQYLGMKTQGFTLMLQQTQADELRMIMQEIAMEQKDKFHKVQRPEVRLAMILTTSLMAVNSQNNLITMKQQAQAKQQVKQQAKPPSIQQTNQRTEANNMDGSIQIPKPITQGANIPGQSKVSPVIPQEKLDQFKEL